MDNIKTCIKELLENMYPEIDFEIEENLSEKGILDSFDIVTLISDIYDRLGIMIPSDDITMDNFYSLKTITLLVKDLLKRK